LAHAQLRSFCGKLGGVGGYAEQTDVFALAAVGRRLTLVPPDTWDLTGHIELTMDSCRRSNVGPPSIEPLA
jgi:hypothetical protein